MTEPDTISEVTPNGDNGVAITSDGWTLFTSFKELNGFVPKVGDEIRTGPSIARPIQYIEIAGTVIRDISDAEQGAIEQAWRDDYKKKKELAFKEHGDEWKATAKKLLPPLAARIQRFELNDGGDVFWIDDGGYELFALTAADALARHVMALLPGHPEEQVKWIEWWDSLNSKSHGYDYKRQAELVPEFGEGHSGNTHGAGVYYAKRVVLGLGC